MVKNMLTVKGRFPQNRIGIIMSIKADFLALKWVKIQGSALFKLLHWVSCLRSYAHFSFACLNYKHSYDFYLTLKKVVCWVKVKGFIIFGFSMESAWARELNYAAWYDWQSNKKAGWLFSHDSKPESKIVTAELPLPRVKKTMSII